MGPPLKDDVALQQAAIAALGRIGGEEALHTLVDLLKKRSFLSEYLFTQIQKREVSPTSMAAIRKHHLRHDRTGYPGLGKGKEPGFLSAIVTVVDAYDTIDHCEALPERLRTFKGHRTDALPFRVGLRSRDPRGLEAGRGGGGSFRAG